MPNAQTCPDCHHGAQDHSALAGCLIVADVNGASCPCERTPASLASLPYDGGTSSGHAGTDTSRERSERRDSSGRTGLLQADVENYLQAAGPDGGTIVDVRQAFPEEHHGTLSGALTGMHKGGRLAMLDGVKRDKCRVYVHPSHVNDRTTVTPGKVRVAKPKGPVTLTAAEADALRRIASKATRFSNDPDAPDVMAVSVQDAFLVTAALEARARDPKA